MYEIKTLNDISPIIRNELPEVDYAISKDCGDPAAILLRSAKMHGLPVGDRLLAIARAGAGVNNIPIDEMAEKAIVVFNTPGANANAVMELVMGAMILISRNVIPAVEWAQNLKGRGEEVPSLVEKGKNQFVGPELKGKRLGVVGLGAIGAMVAGYAHSLHMDVMGYDPYISVDQAWGLSRHIERARDLEAIFSVCDYITLHVPLMENNRGFVDGALLSRMKEGGYLLNFSRDGLVDDAAVIEALDSGKLRGYITDFPTEAMLGIPGAVMIPHLGASTPESEENCARMAAAQVRDYLENGNIRNSVNLPDCALPRAHSYRLSLIHKNVPNTVGRVTAALAARDINIESMVNASRGKYAYTLIEIAHPVPADIAKELQRIDGMMRIRMLPEE